MNVSLYNITITDLYQSTIKHFNTPNETYIKLRINLIQ